MAILTGKPPVGVYRNTSGGAASSSNPGSYGNIFNRPDSNETFYTTKAGEPGAPSGLDGPSGDEIWKIIQQQMSLAGLAGSGSAAQKALYYSLYSPEETAQRGLAYDASQRGALDAQGGYLNSQAGYIGRQGAANTLKNQVAGQGFAAQRNQLLQQSIIDRQNAFGQFAGQGSISSEAARQALGNIGNQEYFRQNGSNVYGMSNPWQGNGYGDIQNKLNFDLGDIYRQVQNTQSDYDVSQGGLYNQLVGVNAQRAGMAPDYTKLGQTDDAYNRLLNGQVNKNVTPEMRALMAALSQAT